MASIRKRGENSYLLVVSMGSDGYGKRRSPKEKMVHPPLELSPKAKEKWLQEEAALFERSQSSSIRHLFMNLRGILDFCEGLRYNNYEKKCKHIYYRSERAVWRSNGIFIWIG